MNEIDVIREQGPFTREYDPEFPTYAIIRLVDLLPLPDDDVAGMSDDEVDEWVSGWWGQADTIMVAADLKAYADFPSTFMDARFKLAREVTDWDIVDVVYENVEETAGEWEANFVVDVREDEEAFQQRLAAEINACEERGEGN